MTMPEDPFRWDADVRLLCDILDPDDHPCSTCGHGIDTHAERDSVVGYCLDCDCGSYCRG